MDHAEPTPSPPEAPVAPAPSDAPPRRRFPMRLPALVMRFVESLCRLNPAVRNYRRAGVGLLDWGRQFLPTYFRDSPSKMHEWLAAELDLMTDERGSRLNVLAPRGGGKSTLASLAYVLRSALEGTEPYIWIVSATYDQARNHLENVRLELEQNALLAHEYPCSGKGDVWRTDKLQLRNGTVIESFGVGQQLRGRRRRADRPTLIVCDDLEHDREVTSVLRRAECRDWFHRVIMKAGDERTNVLSLATALHRDALAMNLATTAGWKSRTFQAIEAWPTDVDLWRQWEEVYGNRENPYAARHARQFFNDRREAMSAGVELLWPEKEDLYTLMKMRTEVGRTAFDREKQNRPIDPERCEWPEEYFEHHIWFQYWPKETIVKTMALDPSKGVTSRIGDYSAYVMLAIDKHGVLYVEADMARRPTPEMVSAGAVLHRRFRPEAFGVEATQFQDLLVGEFEAEFKRRGRRRVAPYLIHSNAPKIVRIRRIGPYLAQRRIRFLRSSRSTQLLVNQLRDFPVGDFDDGPDALEMAIRLADAFLSEDPLPDGLGDRLIEAQ